MQTRSNQKRTSHHDQLFKKPRIHLKPTISIGQALLIVMDYHKKNESKYEELKTLYLRGCFSKESHRRILRFLKEPILNHYHISSNAYITDADPSRRYFETHLALHTLKSQLSNIDLADIVQHFETIFQLLPSNGNKQVTFVFSAKLEQFQSNDYLPKEYSEILRKLSPNSSQEKETDIGQEKEKKIDIETETSSELPHFNEEEKEKLRWMMKASYASLALTNFCNDQMPIAIYNTGFFHDKHRGRISKPDALQNQVKSRHFGIMKSVMPVPPGDIATSDVNSPFLRCADSQHFVPNSEWAKMNFLKMVHPFSNSISGTLLSQLRVMKYLHSIDHFEFAGENKLKNYLRCLITFLLYHSGGHSLYEFTALFSLPSVRAAFRFIPEFEHFNEETLFRTGNEKAFDQALSETISYNKVLLAKKNMHWELEHTIPRTKPIEPIIKEEEFRRTAYRNKKN